MDKKNQLSPRITRPLTETQQIENMMLNLGDISQITPESNEQAILRIRRLQLQLEEAQRDVEVKDKQIENLKRTQRQLESHQELQKKKILSLEERLKVQDAELQKLKQGQSQISEPSYDQSFFEEKVRDLEEEVSSLKKINEKLTKDLQLKKEILVEKQREMEQYKIQERAATQKAKNDEKQLKTKREQAQKEQAQYAQTKLDIATLKRQLNETEKRNKNTEKELTQRHKTNENLRQKVKQLEQNLRQQKQANKQVVYIPQRVEQLSVQPNTINQGFQSEEENLGLSIQQKSARKSIISMSHLYPFDRQGKIRLLNSIIANAENQIDALLSYQDKNDH